MRNYPAPITPATGYPAAMEWKRPYRVIRSRWLSWRFPGSLLFWERAYASGEDSGPGCLGVLGEFKADILNSFVEEQSVVSVVEFGCGDGHQLSLASYPNYIGLDISPSVVQRCIARFGDDPTKSFFLYHGDAWHDPLGVVRAELALSLDVLYHIIEDDSYDNYLRHLFDAASRFVVIYSVNDNRPFSEPYSKPRQFTDWVLTNQPAWSLHSVIENAYPVSDENPDGSWSDFFFFRRVD